jgi:hypothetical protein
MRLSRFPTRCRLCFVTGFRPAASRPLNWRRFSFGFLQNEGGSIVACAVLQEPVNQYEHLLARGELEFAGRGKVYGSGSDAVVQGVRRD